MQALPASQSATLSFPQRLASVEAAAGPYRHACSSLLVFRTRGETVLNLGSAQNLFCSLVVPLAPAAPGCSFPPRVPHPWTAKSRAKVIRKYADKTIHLLTCPASPRPPPPV